jgi:hypothetical protein
LACAIDSATTSATGSPTYRTLPCASTGCGGSFIGLPSVPVMSQPQGRPFTPVRSAPVKTSTTPLDCFAFTTSIARIVACACGERRNQAYVCRGADTSSVYWPVPVRKRASSLRRTAWPMTLVNAPASFVPIVASYLPITVAACCTALTML